jgi:polyhydroxyalkanoate synthesis regulator phasin
MRQLLSDEDQKRQQAISTLQKRIDELEQQIMDERTDK